MNDDQKSEFTEQEQEQRDKLLRKLLTTPPKPRPKRERRDTGKGKPDLSSKTGSGAS